MANNVADTDPAEGSREVIEHELARQDKAEKDNHQPKKDVSKDDPKEPPAPPQEH